jgi:16S rRNA (guanine1207-N2)-methyltransferase
MSAESPSLPSTRPAEARALAAAGNFPGSRILCTTVGRAQAAAQLAAARPDASVCCWFLDDYQRQLAADDYRPTPPNLSLLCAADPPEGDIDLALIPISKSGEAELTRDMLQAASARLALGGTLVAAVDNPRDTWLREQVHDLLPNPTVRAFDDAVVYIAHKKAELRKLRDFRCEIVFRDRGTLVRAVTRPGVFAHRRPDGGARQLLAAAEVAAGMRVLDIGSGPGTVGLALAARDPGIAVHAVDSNARATECTLAGAALNGFANVTAELNATGVYRDPGTFDLALANPPYYADFQIAELFIGAARRSLRAGGRLIIVAKRTDWYEEFLSLEWKEVAHHPSGNYHIITATRA